MKFTSVLKSIILEQSRFEVLFDNLTQPTKNKEGRTQKPKLTKEEFFELVKADPTTKPDNLDFENLSKEDFGKIKAGKYVNWLIKSFLGLSNTLEAEPGSSQYKQELSRATELFFEDLYKVTDDLKKFERFKNRIPQDKRDINKLTPSELYDVVKDFDLTLATTTKAERKTADVHPGAKIVFDGSDWRVVEISDKSALGKEAACFYGGQQQETRWCTSAPGLKYFETYIKDGPLLVIYNPNDPKISPNTGLPIERYQFHFESSQFMDKDDRQINLVEYLNGPMSELKDFLKPYFVKGVTGTGQDSFKIESFTSGVTGKFISLYGLDDLFKNIPRTITEIKIVNPDKNGITIDIPSEISEFKDLWQLQLDNCITKLPDSICQLKKLNFLTLRNNLELRNIPECVVDLPCLSYFNASGSSNLNVPKKMEEIGDSMGENMFSFENEERCQSSYK